MTCKECNVIKRFFCLVSCDEMNDSFCAVDESLKAENDRYKTIQMSAWAVIFFILSVVASCELVHPVPDAAGWNITPELRYRANHQLKEVP